ncbi:MAG: ATP-binding cassette domain-containing protein [Burkholderiaceae bacterium]
MGDVVIRGQGLVLHDASFRYRDTIVVDGVSGCFAPGSLTAIVGPNGAGKTTLLKGLLGLIGPCRGSVVRSADGPATAYLAQSREGVDGFPVDVADFVAMGLWPRIGSLAAVTRPLAARVGQAIAAVGLQGREHHWVGELSGGQFQRVRFARLIVQDAPLILLDEPFAAIDRQTTVDLMRVVTGWHAQGRTVIAVLHDLELVRAHFPQTLVLAGRVLAWGATDRSLAVLEPVP